MDKSISFNNVKKMPFSFTNAPVKMGDSQSDISTLSYDPEGKFLAVGTYDGAIKLYSSFTGKQV